MRSVVYKYVHLMRIHSCLGMKGLARNDGTLLCQRKVSELYLGRDIVVILGYFSSHIHIDLSQRMRVVQGLYMQVSMHKIRGVLTNLFSFTCMCRISVNYRFFQPRKANKKYILNVLHQD